MKIHFLYKNTLIIFLLSILIISCKDNDDSTNTNQNKSLQDVAKVLNGISSDEMEATSEGLEGNLFSSESNIVSNISFHHPKHKKSKRYGKICGKEYTREETIDTTRFKLIVKSFKGDSTTAINSCDENYFKTFPLSFYINHIDSVITPNRTNYLNRWTKFEFPTNFREFKVKSNAKGNIKKRNLVFDVDWKSEESYNKTDGYKFEVDRKYTFEANSKSYYFKRTFRHNKLQIRKKIERPKELDVYNTSDNKVIGKIKVNQETGKFEVYNLDGNKVNI